MKRYKLDISREWTPAISVATGKRYGPDKVYTRGNPSDHKAQEVVLELDIVEKGREGNRAFKQIMHRLDIECFGIKYKKSKSSARRMGKYKAKEVKELSEYVKANKKGLRHNMGK